MIVQTMNTISMTLMMAPTGDADGLFRAAILFVFALIFYLLMNEKGDSGKASPREPRTFIQTRKNKKVTKLRRKKSDTPTEKNSEPSDLSSAADTPTEKNSEPSDLSSATDTPTEKNSEQADLSSATDTPTEKNSEQAELCSSVPSAEKSVKPAEVTCSETSSDGTPVNAFPKSDACAITKNNEQLDNELLLAASDGDVEKIRLLVQAGADVNVKGFAGLRPIDFLIGKSDTMRVYNGVKILCNSPRMPINDALNSVHEYLCSFLLFDTYFDHSLAGFDEIPLGAFLTVPGLDMYRVQVTQDEFAYSNYMPTLYSIITLADETKYCKSLIDEHLEKLKTNDEKLVLAAESGDVATLDSLLANHAYVNTRDFFGRTPLHAAAASGYEDCVARLLAEPFADPFIEAGGQTPLDIAEEWGYTECANLLRQQMEKDEEPINLAPDEYNNAILNAAQQGDSRTLRRLIAAGADVNATNSWGFTPLAETAAHGYVECMKLLLAAPEIDVNKASLFGDTPILWAALHRHYECLELMVKHGEVDFSITYENTGLLSYTSNSRYNGTVLSVLPSEYRYIIENSRYWTPVSAEVSPSGNWKSWNIPIN